MGEDDELNAISSRSRFWRIVWIIGDLSYYAGLIAPMIVGFSIAWIMAPPPIDSMSKVLKCVGLAILFVPAGWLVLTPIGFALCIGLKAWARRKTGVVRPPES
jgi:hypothetical protein